ncbi:thermonuclease family protein [Caenispirillum salinarum]|uniref:thermonuclease family protein n=1 Tax=Caenispirillum salinarum TaxID=859058 RepID=UPI001F46B02E|nr:thermonuclease family protein [Caenispirillum salinarum]
MVGAMCGAIKAGRPPVVIALLLAALAVPAAPAAASELERLGPALRDAGTAAVVEVIDGDTVVLDDGREVRFVGIQAPKLPLGRPGFEEWPLAPEARAEVAGMIAGEAVAVRPGATERDRHGRVLAHLFRLRDGLWVQGAMLRRGLARVYTFPDNRLLAEEMLAAEAEARRAVRGIWALDWYAVRDAERLAQRRGPVPDGFFLVRGTVRDVARVRGTTYLNFGPDWRTDFTVSIDSRARRLFEDAGVDLEALEGREVLARGWIRSRNGPMIEATHPEQLQTDPALVRARKED